MTARRHLVLDRFGVSGRYLDPVAAAASIAGVRAQGARPTMAAVG